MTIGLIAGLLSAIVLICIYNPIKESAGSILAMIASSTIPLEDLWLRILVAFSCAGILIGALGGFISITKYLRKEGGEIIGW